jgi:hypothetical protein
VKGIQICSNQGQCAFQRGDNRKNIKMGRGHLKVFFSRTTGLILTRFGTNISEVEGIQVCANEGDNPSPMGENSKRVKIH